MNELNRATGRTTRTLHRMIASFFEGNDVYLIADTQAYSEGLQRTVCDVLEVYGLEPELKIKRGNIRAAFGGSITFRGYDIFHSPSQRPVPKEHVFYDHYVDERRFERYS